MLYSDVLNRKLPYAFGNELAWLRASAKDFNRAVMIGAGPGVMAVALMEGNPDLDLLIIDIATCDYAIAHLEDAGIFNVKHIIANSHEYGNMHTPLPLDFLLVDGDHSKEGVIRDIKAWFKHIRPGGTIFFHDYEEIDPTTEVKAALAELEQEEFFTAHATDAPGISMVYRKLG